MSKSVSSRILSSGLRGLVARPSRAGLRGGPPSSFKHPIYCTFVTRVSISKSAFKKAAPHYTLIRNHALMRWAPVVMARRLNPALRAFAGPPAPRRSRARAKARRVLPEAGARGEDCRRLRARPISGSPFFMCPRTIKLSYYSI